MLQAESLLCHTFCEKITQKVRQPLRGRSSQLKPMLGWRFAPRKKMEESYQAITDFIFIEDKPEKADIILVPGGSSPELMEKACELLLAGYAPLLLPSGGPNKKITEYEAEWDYFLDIAKKKGISENSILKENKATNTFENAIFSKEVVKKKNIEI